MRSLLDHQADGIEYTLHSHGIEASVVGGNVSPRLIQFHVKLAAGIKFNRVAALTDEIAIALGADYCRVTRDGYFVRIEVPRADPVVVRLFALLENLPAELPEVAPVLGLDENGVPLLVRLVSNDIGHVLVSGAPGAGKTVLTQSMIASLALQNGIQHLRMLLIDTSGKAYTQYDGLPNLIGPIVTEAYDAILKLRWLVREMEKRSETGRTTPAIALFVDEVADLVRVSGREVSYALARLTQEGRELGIHVVASTHSAQVVNVLAKNNFSTRIVGYVTSAAEARVASGQEESEADRLMGQGDFLLYTRNQVTRLQAAHIAPEEMALTVEHLGGQPGLSARAAQRRALQSFVAEETGSGPAYASTGESRRTPVNRAEVQDSEAEMYPASTPYTYPERSEAGRDNPPRQLRPRIAEEPVRRTAESRAPYTYDTPKDTGPEEDATAPTYFTNRRRARPALTEVDDEPFGESEETPVAPVLRPEPERQPYRQPEPVRPQRSAPPPPPHPVEDMPVRRPNTITREPAQRPVQNTPVRPAAPRQMDMQNMATRRSEPVINNRPRPVMPQPLRRPPTPAPLGRYETRNPNQATNAADEYAGLDYGEPDYLADDSQLEPDERGGANALPGVNSNRQIPIQINVGRSNNPK